MTSQKLSHDCLTDIISDLMQPPKVIEAYAGNLADVSLHGHLTVQQDAKISYNISMMNNR